MEGPDVVLRPFRRGDAPVLAGWLADEALLAQTAPDWSHPMSADRIAREYLDHGTGAEVLTAESGGGMVGHLGLRIVHGTSGHLFHVIVDPRRLRRGYGLAMLHAVARLAFTGRDLHRLQLYVFDDNIPAIAAYLRAGYRIEGHHSDHYRFGDRWLNTYSMALLRPHWEERGPHKERHP